MRSRLERQSVFRQDVPALCIIYFSTEKISFQLLNSNNIVLQVALIAFWMSFVLLELVKSQKLTVWPLLTQGLLYTCNDDTLWCEISVMIEFWLEIWPQIISVHSMGSKFVPFHQIVLQWHVGHPASLKRKIENFGTGYRTILKESFSSWNDDDIGLKDMKTPWSVIFWVFLSHLIFGEMLKYLLQAG